MAQLFHIITFGCQMNAADSDWLRRSLTSLGLREAAPEQAEQADLYVVNTCSVRDKPEQKVYSELGRIRRFLNVQGRTALVCVGGCVAQQIGEGLFKRFREVRLVFGPGGVSIAPEAMLRLLREPDLRLSYLDFPENYQERPLRLQSLISTPNGNAVNATGVTPDKTPAVAQHPISNNVPGNHPGKFGGMAENIPGSTSATAPQPEKTPAQPGQICASVTIMQGCDNFCAYCIVPYVRGRQKSRRVTEILAECRALLAAGGKEITLLGQNVNSFGQDLAQPELGFTPLLRQVAALPGLERLRFVTPHPKDLAPELIAAFGELPNLCPRLHLPLQSGSDRVLKAMGRKYDLAAYMKIVEGLKKARPEILLSTDIIVGFPGETEEDFQATLRAMQEMECAFSFSFVYSDRPGTRAEKMEGKIEQAVGLERLARLQAWQAAYTEKLLKAQVGAQCKVLVEGASLPPPATQKREPTLQGKDERGIAVSIALPTGGNTGSFDGRPDIGLGNGAGSGLGSGAGNGAGSRLGSGLDTNINGKPANSGDYNLADASAHAAIQADAARFIGKILPVKIVRAGKTSLRGELL